LKKLSKVFRLRGLTRNARTMRPHESEMELVIIKAERLVVFLRRPQLRIAKAPGFVKVSTSRVAHCLRWVY